MRINVEITDTLFRKAKATATKRDVSVEDLLTQALREHMERLADDFSRNQLSAPPWMRAFGGLRRCTRKRKRSIESCGKSSSKLKWTSCSKPRHTCPFGHRGATKNCCELLSREFSNLASGPLMKPASRRIFHSSIFFRSFATLPRVFRNPP
jgi:hypothetical protein